MRTIIIIILNIFLLFGCKEHPKPKIVLKTQNKTIVYNFNKALEITEKLIAQRFSKNELDKYFALNTRATGFIYKNAIYNIKDSLRVMPTGYMIFYDFIFKNDTIGLFRVDLDSCLNIDSYWYNRLFGYRLFLDHKLIITETDALKIAKKFNIEGVGVSAIFKTDREYPDTINCNGVEFYWTVQKDCNGCNSIDIDAKTGIVFNKGKINWIF